MSAHRITREFIGRIPKTDLHVHLDGSLRPSTLLELARDAGVKLPATDEAGLLENLFTGKYNDLPGYLRGFAYTTAVLQTAEALERAAFELAEDSIAEGARYLEVRFAPQLHMNDRLDFQEILASVHRGMVRAQQRHNRKAAVRDSADLPFHFGIIACAMRAFSPAMGSYYRQLTETLRHASRKEWFAAASLELVRAAVALRDDTGWPIVGFDIAGEEAGYPAGVHREAYRHAHRNFLKKTVHAGEAYGPESIFQAITDCHANRIGHGTFLFAHEMVRDPSVGNPKLYVDRLAEYIASRRITLEVCLSSNLQTTPEIPDISLHPIGKMLEEQLSVSLCTDNRLVSRTTISDELFLLASKTSCTAYQFRNVIEAGFKGAFYPGPYIEKRAFVRHAMDRYDTVAREFGIETQNTPGE